MDMKVVVEENKLVPYLTIFELAPLPVIIFTIMWIVLVVPLFTVNIYQSINQSVDFGDDIFVVGAALLISIATIVICYSLFSWRSIEATSDAVYASEVQKRIGQELRVIEPGIGLILNRGLAKTIIRMERHKNQHEQEQARLDAEQAKQKKYQEEEQHYLNGLEQTRQIVNEIANQTD